MENLFNFKEAFRIQFLVDLSNPDSEVSKAYRIGQDIADFEIDAKLLHRKKLLNQKGKP